MHMIKFNDIWEQKLFPLLIGRGWKYRRGGENIVTIFSPRGEDIVGVKISSHTGIPEEDTFTSFKMQTWLSDFISWMNPFRIVCTWPIWADIAYYIENTCNTVISSLSTGTWIFKQLPDNKRPKLGMPTNRATED